MVDNTSEPETSLRWELPSCKPLPPLKGHVGRVYAAAFSPDGKSLYSVDSNRTLMRWDWAAGKSHTLVSEKGPEFDGPTVAPDGKTLATYDVGAQSGEIVLWEAASGVKQRTLTTPYPPKGTSSWRTHLQFAENGQFLVSTNPELTNVAVWPLAKDRRRRRRPPRNLRELVVTPDGKQLVTNSTAGMARCGTSLPARSNAASRP